MSDAISFFVAGLPQSRGSKRAFPVKRKDGRVGVSVADTNPKGKDWMNLVAIVAHAAMNGRAPIAGPVSLRLSFTMPRPKSHFGTGRNSNEVKASAPHYHTIKPDRGKLARGVEDALTQVVYVDDAQIVGGWTEKQYGTHPGVAVEVLELLGAADGEHGSEGDRRRCPAS